MGIEGSTLVMKQNYLPLTGGQMKGGLVLSKDPQGPMDAVSKQFLEKKLDDILANYVSNNYIPNVQASSNLYILKSGDIMTGILTLLDDPVGNLDAATRQYVDSEVANILPPIGLPGQSLMVNTTGTGLYFSYPQNSLYTAGNNIVINNNVISLAPLPSAQCSDIYYDVGLRNDGSLILKPNPLPNHNCISATLATPPHYSNIGDTYIVPPNANGVWSGQQSKVTVNYNGSRSWLFYTPNINDTYTLSDTNITVQWNGTSWVQALTFLPISGGNLVGPLTLSGDPQTLYGAATKRYVDANTYSCLILSSVGQNVTVNPTAIIFTSTSPNYIAFDPHTMHSSVLNNTRITIQTNGSYKIKCAARVSDITPNANLTVYRNGVSGGFTSYSQSTTVGDHCSVSHSELLTCSTGDYLEVYISSSSSSYTILWASFFVEICR